ncbi:MAG: MOSC N-terminal beta barrel domain-containing protein, partial [Cocleimonas sp.]|nr:MOSC N-terminal beta barrel domain-containing protein [Cocleimonas sp.]
MNITVNALTIYPVKSLAGIALDSSMLDSMGLVYDRRWMLVTPDGNFLSQRKVPKMALIQPRFEQQQLILSNAEQQDLIVTQPISQQTLHVTIWNDTVT